MKVHQETRYVCKVLKKIEREIKYTQLNVQKNFLNQERLPKDDLLRVLTTALGFKTFLQEGKS